jgi:hypothetical protein
VLRDLGCIEVVRTEQRRGAVEHFYKAVMLPFLDDAQWGQLPLAMRRGLAAQTFRRIFAEGSAAGGAGGFDRAGAHVDRMLLDLDAQGWRDLSALLVDVMRRAEAIQKQSDARQGGAEGGEDSGSPSELAILHFARVEIAPAAPRRRARTRPVRSPRLP